MNVRTGFDTSGHFRARHFAVGMIAAVLLCFAGQAGGQAPAKKAPPKAAGEQPKFKAIWEPVNVPEDLQLKSVHFASADVGWVAGGKTVMQGGVIYHTKDGGKTWELQVGDPQSSDRGFSDLRFLDATQGFAVQGSPG
ncbi:MAG: WD40/YVTN/BNR-like repeat-containing protein, partial [Anaerolineales bacterium]